MADKSTKYDFEVDTSNPNTTYAQIIALCGDAENILDIGCAAGSVGSFFAGKGRCVTGVDMDVGAVEAAREVLFKAIVGSFPSSEVTKQLQGGYDVIIMADTLEHMIDPKAALVEAGRLLAKGGFVVVSIPNFGHWSARRDHLTGRFEYRDMGLTDSSHLRFFTVSTFEKLAVDSGYKIVDRRDVSSYNNFGDITFRILG
ncbi:methyltransferase domain-containing protein, partial [Candidatus Hydrogenedentota bacterium]